MSLAQIVVIGIGVVLCAIAAVAWRAGWRLRVGVFVAGLVAFGISYLALMLLPFSYGSLYIFILPIGPLAIFIVGLLRRRAVAKVIGANLAILLVLSYSYVAVATHMSHASYPIEGVLHLATFLKGQGFVRDNLNDPSSAAFKDLRLTMYKGHQYMCGEVNARNRMGGLVGYTRFYVQTDQYVSFPFFDNDAEHNSFNQYMSTCYGDDWNKDM
jgi:hypothetical protein